MLTFISMTETREVRERFTTVPGIQYITLISLTQQIIHKIFEND